MEIIGHRGASYDAPENTLTAMKLAWEQDADAIELDLHLSQDGRIAVIHDADAKRVGGVDRKVTDQTWNEIRKLDVGSWKAPRFKGEPVPRLESILATIPPGRRAVLEIKCGPEILPELGRVLRDSGKEPRELALISFDFETLRESKKRFPRIEHYFLHGYKKDPKTGRLPELAPLVAQAKEARFDGLDLHFDWPIDASFVSTVKSSGLKLVVWTVNDPAVARRLAAAGVDGLTTDRPGWMKEEMNAQPIRLHPQNPHYFQWRGQPAILITAGEHYGAVLNLNFDYVRYFEVLKAHRFNLTRIFSGAYREVAGSFNITGNTLAPAAGRFVSPWARSATPEASDGGNKFDLTKWDDAYFARLADFVGAADERGVVVELVFFCTMYDDKVWEASPMNARNNVNGIGAVGRREVYSAKDGALLAAQHAVVRKLVTDLNRFDNLYYEVCNEPYERGGLTQEWNDQIIATVAATEADLPKKHLVAEGFPPSSAAVSGLNPRVSVLNFHAAKPDAVRINHHLNRVIAFDETGGSDRSDRKYRTEGWEFVLAGGGVYDHLDFSFTPEREDGTAVPLPPATPGGGGPQLRHQLQVLKEFIESFDFIRMTPDSGAIKQSRITARQPDGTSIPAKATVRALTEAGKAYAIYINGGTQAALDLDLPSGQYRAEWLNTKNGTPEGSDAFNHGGGIRTLVSPAYSEDIALRLIRQ